MFTACCACFVAKFAAILIVPLLCDHIFDSLICNFRAKMAKIVSLLLLLVVVDVAVGFQKSKKQ